MSSRETLPRHFCWSRVLHWAGAGVQVERAFRQANEPRRRHVWKILPVEGGVALPRPSAFVRRERAGWRLEPPGDVAPTRRFRTLFQALQAARISVLVTDAAERLKG